VLIARALAAEPDILLLDDPMRGVDVATKRELFAVLREEAGRGRTILLYTTETEELVHCDRTYVFFEGRLTDEIPRHAFSEERLLRASFAHAA
jgi:ribose transport system ATP-binding protein